MTGQAIQRMAEKNRGRVFVRRTVAFTVWVEGASRWLVVRLCQISLKLH